VLVVDGNGVVLLTNDHIKGLFEISPRDQHFTSVLRAPAVVGAVDRAIAGHGPKLVSFEVRVPTPRHFSVHVSPLEWQGSAGPAALVMIRDLTREQQIERMRADFVANASHELRTPLAALLGFIETMQGAAKNDEAARQKFLGLMRSQAERMKRLIDDLLSLSRIELNEHVRPSGHVDLGLVARHVGDVLDGMAKEAGCEIRIAIGETLPVVGDWDELVQVMQNLVENALKYANSGKLVTIEGRCTDGQVELTVRDRGPGIAAEHIPRLTERFYRVNVQDSRSRGGTGLGLAIVKHILNRHRGRLAISSEPGSGSSFSVRLPRQE